MGPGFHPHSYDDENYEDDGAGMLDGWGEDDEEFEAMMRHYTIPPHVHCRLSSDGRWLVVAHCRFCGERHYHRAGEPGAPRLGTRVAHCVSEPAPEYTLVLDPERPPRWPEDGMKNGDPHSLEDRSPTLEDLLRMYGPKPEVDEPNNLRRRS